MTYSSFNMTKDSANYIPIWLKHLGKSIFLSRLAKTLSVLLYVMELHDLMKRNCLASVHQTLISADFKQVP